MKLAYVDIQNFGPFRDHVRVELDGQGLVSILGNNQSELGKDSNGAGKSTILDAILWGLFGQTGPRRETSGTPSGLKSDDVINEDAGKDCRVSVAWRDHEQSYRADRWRKCKDEEKASGARLMHYNGTWEPLADLDDANIQGRIDEALGFDYRLASQVLIRSQEDAYNFCQSTPKERFGILTQIEGIEELDAVEASARARAKNLIGVVTRLDGELRGLEQTIHLYQEESYETEIKAWEATRADRIAQAQAALQAEEEVRAGKQAQVDQKGAYQEQLTTIQGQLAQMTHPPEPEGLAGWRARISTLTSQQAQAEADLRVVLARLDELQERGHGLCEACGQPITAEHVEHRRAGFDSEAQGHEQRIVQIRADLAEAHKVVNEADAAIREHTQTLQAERERLSGLQAQVTQVLRGISVAEAELADTSQLDHLRAGLEAAQSEENPWIAKRDELQVRLDQARERSVAMKVELESARTDAKLMEWWIRNIPSLKAWIFDSVVGELTASANRWLTHLMGGTCWVQIDSTSTTKSGDVRDKIGLKCFNWKADGSFVERPYKRWSGGEKRRISLAVDWALAERLAQRAHAQCSFLALDEVDRHLDASGREGLLAALHELRREKDTVLVITHDENFAAAPDKKWIVTKTLEGSRIEVQDEQREEASSPVGAGPS